MPHQAADTILFFDAGFTLLYPHPGVGHHYANAALREGVEADPAALDKAFAAAWKKCKTAHPAHPRVPYGITPAQSRAFWGRVVEETFRAAGHAPPRRPAFHHELFDLFAGAACWRLYPDVEEALSLAGELGFTLGVLSNWDHRLHGVLAGLGILERFALVLTSSEAGAEKPHREIFRRAESLTPSFQRHALIGDEATSDGDGAERAGWDRCLVLRGAPPPPTGHPTAPSLPGAVARIHERVSK